MFSTFLVENEKQIYFNSIKYIEEIIFSLTLAYKLIYDDVHISQVTDTINLIPEYINKNQEIILSTDLISEKIYNKLNNDNKNLKILFKMSILESNYNELNQDTVNYNYQNIINFFNKIKENCKIYKKIENNLIKLINKSYFKDEITVLFHLYIHSQADKCLLNINFLSNKELMKNIQIIMKNNNFEINESFFRFIFNFSKHFNLTLTENIEKDLPKTYKEIQNFIYYYPDHFNNENSIIYYIKKYLEEKEKYYLKKQKTNKDKIIKEKNELEICQNLLKAIQHFFIQKYNFVFDKNSYHFSNPQLIYFNSLFCDFLRKYVLDKDYYNIFIHNFDFIELDNKYLENIKKNNIILYKIDKLSVEFYPFIKEEQISFNTVKIIFNFKLDLNMNKSIKNIYINIM